MAMMFDSVMVNDTHQALLEMGYQLDKYDVYLSLLDQGVIDQDGQLLPHALEKGLVLEADEVANLSFEEFLNLYPFFKRFNSKHFKLIDGYWELDDLVIKQIEFLQKHDQLDVEEEYDLYYFFKQRHIIEE